MTEGVGREVAKAVLIAALSALVTKLVEWGVEELRKRVDPPEKPKEAENE